MRTPRATDPESSRRRFPLPLLLIVLDVAGALLVARGAWLAVNGAGGLWHILSGLLLMTPLAVYLLNWRRRAPAASASRERGQS